jgi:CTP synthase (UTP-ammonia lyase)
VTNTRLAILGEFTPTFAPHAATNAAVEHACAASGLVVESDWVSTAAVDELLFAQYRGLWVAPGSPYKDMDRTLWAIRFAREHGIPCFGTCGGFQHMVLEYARNVLGFADAQHAEYDPYASRLFVSRLACSLVGREMELRFAPDSQVARIYGATEAREQYYCNFGVNPDCVLLLSRGPLRVVGSDAEGEVRVVELPGHPFFIGTLFVPQARSTRQQPHPLVTAFLRSCIDRSAGHAQVRAETAGQDG